MWNLLSYGLLVTQVWMFGGHAQRHTFPVCPMGRSQTFSQAQALPSPCWKEIQPNRNLTGLAKQPRPIYGWIGKKLSSVNRRKRLFCQPVHSGIRPSNSPQLLQPTHMYRSEVKQEKQQQTFLTWDKKKAFDREDTLIVMVRFSCHFDTTLSLLEREFQ